MSEKRSSAKHLDPNAPLVLDTRELGRRPGSMRTVQRTVPAPADLGVEMVAVPTGAELELDLRLESVMEGVLVSGTARAPLAGECARCLEPLASDLEVSLQQLYAYPGSGSADDEEIDQLEGDLLDLEPALRDAVVLALPLSPVCSEDCLGLCVTCGARLSDDPGHGHADTDPRWAALQSVALQQDLPAGRHEHDDDRQTEEN